MYITVPFTKKSTSAGNKGKDRASDNPEEPPVPQITEEERLERERTAAEIREGRERVNAQMKMCERMKLNRRVWRRLRGWVEKVSR